MRVFNKSPSSQLCKHRPQQTPRQKDDTLDSLHLFTWSVNMYDKSDKEIVLTSLF